MPYLIPSQVCKNAPGSRCTMLKFLRNITKINVVLRKTNQPVVDKKALAIMLLHVLNRVKKTKLPHLNSSIAEESVGMTAENPAKWTTEALEYLSYRQVTSTEGFPVELYDLIRLASEHEGTYPGIQIQLPMSALGFISKLIEEVVQFRKWETIIPVDFSNGYFSTRTEEGALCFYEQSPEKELIFLHEDQLPNYEAIAESVNVDPGILTIDLVRDIELQATIQKHHYERWASNINNPFFTINKICNQVDLSEVELIAEQEQICIYSRSQCGAAILTHKIRASDMAMGPEFRKGLKQTAKTLNVSPGPWGWVHEYKNYVSQLNMLGIQNRQTFLARYIRINKELKNHLNKPQGLSQTVLTTLITFLISNNDNQPCLTLHQVLWKICTQMDDQVNCDWAKETVRQLKKIKIADTKVLMCEIFNINLILTLKDSIPLLSFELERMLEIISQTFFPPSTCKAYHTDYESVAHQGTSTTKEDRKPVAH
jgi:hypothetical protein